MYIFLRISLVFLLFFSFNLNAKNLGGCGNLFKEINRINASSPQDSFAELKEIFLGKSRKERKEIIRLFNKLPSSSLLWDGDIFKRLKPLNEKEVTEIFKVLLSKDVKTLIKKASTNIESLNLHERRAVVLLLTQNWRLTRRVSRSTRWLNKIKEFSVQKFYRVLNADRADITLSEFLLKLAGSNRDFVYWLKGRNINAEVFKDIINSKYSVDLISGLQQKVLSLEKLYKKSTGIRRLWFYGLYSVAKKHLKALSPAYRHMLQQTEGLGMRASNYFVFSFVPSTFKTAKRVLVYTIIAAAIISSESAIINSIDNTRADLFNDIKTKTFISENEEPSTSEQQLNDLMAKEFSSSSADRLSDKQFSNSINDFIKQHPEVSW